MDTLLRNVLLIRYLETSSILALKLDELFQHGWATIIINCYGWLMINFLMDKWWFYADTFFLQDQDKEKLFESKLQQIEVCTIICRKDLHDVKIYGGYLVNWIWNAIYNEYSVK